MKLNNIQRNRLKQPEVHDHREQETNWFDELVERWSWKRALLAGLVGMIAGFLAGITVCVVAGGPLMLFPILFLSFTGLVIALACTAIE